MPSTATNAIAFPDGAPAALPVFYRTYSRRKADGQRESFDDVVTRCLEGLQKLGLDQWDIPAVKEQFKGLRALPSGRWLWVGGTPWLDKPENYSGAYNCTSTNITDLASLRLMMDLAMMGCGTGAVLEPDYIRKLSPVRNRLEISQIVPYGTKAASKRLSQTDMEIYKGGRIKLVVGDSRAGWVEAYEMLIWLATEAQYGGFLTLRIDLSNVRPPGVPLEGFGGVANPVKLPELFRRAVEILNNAVGRSLSSLEICLLIDEAASTVVAGNIRRSAGMRQFDSADREASNAKANLWKQGDDGSWSIDPKKQALRMANHTRIFHYKPSQSDLLESVRQQFHSGEGAIQFAPEAIARANADLLSTPALRTEFVERYCERGPRAAREWMKGHGVGHWLHGDISEEEAEHRMQRYGLNPCGEIIGSDFHCNLSEVHLNLIDPNDEDAQKNAFTAAALAACTLLKHRFNEKRYQKSREWDPIIGVSFTGLFDFFVHAFGVQWLKWFVAGRPKAGFPEAAAWPLRERQYFRTWRETVERTVRDFCRLNKILRVPNRCTTVQPAGTKSLLSGASPGWHPPKSQRFIRRITFGKNDPVALACMDYGYKIVPSQSSVDQNGKLLDDPMDPRCSEWLVEIPTEVSWANLPGADEVDLSKIPATAQFDFYMGVQRAYTTHNTSATIEFREDEIIPLANAIHDTIHGPGGYISAALLARFDASETFPRLPFEPISRDRYIQEVKEVNIRQISHDFEARLAIHDKNADKPLDDAAGPMACDSDKCLVGQ